MGKSDNRIVTDKKINDAPICNRCPARIYQKEDDVIKYGKGNLLPNIIFVLPIEAVVNRHIEEYLHQVTKQFVDINAEYITYHPKCPVNSPVEGYAGFCRQYLLHEIKKLKPKKVIFFGVDIPDEIIELSNTIQVYKLDNLLSIYYGQDKLNKFIDALSKIL